MLYRDEARTNSDLFVLCNFCGVLLQIQPSRQNRWGRQDSVQQRTVGQASIQHMCTYIFVCIIHIHPSFHPSIAYIIHTYIHTNVQAHVTKGQWDRRAFKVAGGHACAQWRARRFVTNVNICTVHMSMSMYMNTDSMSVYIHTHTHSRIHIVYIYNYIGVGITFEPDLRPGSMTHGICSLSQNGKNPVHSLFISERVRACVRCLRA